MAWNLSLVHIFRDVEFVKADTFRWAEFVRGYWPVNGLFTIWTAGGLFPHLSRRRDGFHLARRRAGFHLHAGGAFQTAHRAHFGKSTITSANGQRR